MKRTLAAISVFTLLLSACSGGDAEETTTTLDGSTTTSESTETTVASETTTTVAAETTSTEVQATGGASCLEGTWVLDDEAFFAQMSELFDENDVDGQMSPSEGTFTVEMGSDGSMSAVRDDWGFSVESTEGTVNMRINGTQTGTWSVEGSTLFLDTDPGATYEVETTFETGGQVMTLPQAPVEVPDDLFTTESEFTCDGDTFTVSAEGFTSTLRRP